MNGAVSGARFAGQIGEVRSLGLGMYEDDGNQLHVDIGEVMDHMGWEHTPENRERAVVSVREALNAKMPDTPVVVTRRGMFN